MQKKGKKWLQDIIDLVLGEFYDHKHERFTVRCHACLPSAVNGFI